MPSNATSQCAAVKLHKRSSKNTEKKPTVDYFDDNSVTLRLGCLITELHDLKRHDLVWFPKTSRTKKVCEPPTMVINHNYYSIRRVLQMERGTSSRTGKNVQQLVVST